MQIRLNISAVVIDEKPIDNCSTTVVIDDTKMDVAYLVLALREKAIDLKNKE